MQLRFSSALRVALAYGVLAGLWILVSDRLLGAFASDQASLVRLGILKGWTFVLVTATLLFVERRRADGRYATELQSEQDLRDDRKRAEEALQESQQLFHKVFHYSPTAIVLSRLSDGRFVEANENFLRLTGYALDEVMGLTSTEAGITSDPKAREERLAVLKEEGQLPGFEVQIRRKSGELRDGLASVGIVTFSGEQFALSHFLDITDRKRAESSLAESQGRLAGIIASAMDAIITVDDQQRIVLFNEAAEKMFGTPANEVLGQSLDRFIPARFREIHRKHIQHFGETNLTTRRMGVSSDLTGLRADGAEFPLESSISQIEVAGKKFFTVILRDTTQRRLAEQELRKARDELELRVQERTAELSQANALLQTMMDHVPDQVFFKDAQSRFIQSSRSQAELMGLSDRGEVVGRTDFDFFPHAQRSYEQEQEIIRTGQPLIDLEEHVVWPDGHATWVSTNKAPLRDKDGHIIGTFGIARDVTERKRIEHAIRELNDDLGRKATQLEAANQELEAFSYSVSHDLRAPLRAIDGYTSVLLEDYGPTLDEEGKRICGVVTSEAHRMGELIDDLLSLSRVGRTVMNTLQLDMKALANSVYARLTTPETRGRIDFRVGALPRSGGDPVLIQQVWANLIGNAIKYSSARERAVIEVGGRRNSNETIYHVRDNGAGFDMEYADKLFGTFQRLHSEREFEGTGVGLAIVQRIIHRHGGRVWGEGEVDNGATFYFALPSKKAQA